MERKLPLRRELPQEYTWRLEDMYADDQVWESERVKLKKMLPRLSSFQGALSDSAEQLFAALSYRDEVFQKLGKLYIYAHMRHDEDVTASFYQELNERASQLYAEASAYASYFSPELLSMDEALIKTFLQQHKPLQVYAHMLERLNLQRPHVLSTKEEAILAQAAEVFSTASNVYGTLNNADLKWDPIQNEQGEEIVITPGRYIHLMETGNQQVRKDAFDSMYQSYEDYQNTFANTLSGVVKKNNLQAKIRNYQSARHAALSKNHIPEKVYDQLIDTIHDYLPMLQRYMKLKKAVLGLDELHMYDIYASLVKDIDFKITYSKAQEILTEALKPMGNEYLSILNEALTNRWIDVYENKGKRSGAYSSGTYGTHPYILLNWQDDVNNLFTLAHEFGHSAHSYYSRSTQPYIYSNYTIFVAEVASTCNEALLDHYLSKHVTDPQKKLYLANRYLEGFRATVFRQAMFAEFEHSIYSKAQDGVALTAERLNTLYYDLNKKYFGDEVVIDQKISLEWARIPHFYLNFYVYQYATGSAAAAALSQQILTEGKPAVDRYIEFLKSGDADYSMEILKKAGVDMTSSRPIKAAMDIFSNKLDDFEQLLSHL